VPKRDDAEPQGNWRCYLCRRSVEQIGTHALPVKQRAHLLPNRLTGGARRYGGAKNVFTESEWATLLEALGPELCGELSCGGEVRQKATGHCYQLCGECYEEVLSELVYVPSVMRVLRKRFHGASRVDKILLLTKGLKLGAEALAREMT
jgi:hypothetical protein